MIKLSFALRYYVHDRMTRYSAWRNVRVILSDASVPGEVRGRANAALHSTLTPFPRVTGRAQDHQVHPAPARAGGL